MGHNLKCTWWSMHSSSCYRHVEWNCASACSVLSDVHKALLGRSTESIDGLGASSKSPTSIVQSDGLRLQLLLNCFAHHHPEVCYTQSSSTVHIPTMNRSSEDGIQLDPSKSFLLKPCYLRVWTHSCSLVIRTNQMVY